MVVRQISPQLLRQFGLQAPPDQADRPLHRHGPPSGHGGQALPRHGVPRHLRDRAGHRHRRDQAVQAQGGQRHVPYRSHTDSQVVYQLYL